MQELRPFYRLKPWFFFAALAVAPQLQAQEIDSGEDEVEAESDDQSGGESPSPAPEPAIHRNAEGRLVHRSGETSARNSAWFQLEMRFHNVPTFSDYRGLAAAVPDPTTIPSPNAQPAQVKVFESELGARVAAYGYADRGAFVDLFARIPFRHLSSSDTNHESGYEHAGFEIGLEGAPMLGFVLRTSAAQRRSPRFKLVDKHWEWNSSFRYQAYESTVGRLSFGMKIGPDYNLSFSQGPSSLRRYGAIAGFGVDLFTDIRSSGKILLRLGTSADMKRVLGYQIAGIEQGGAGLLAVSPYIEFPVMDAVWIGVRGELPVFRPRAREAAFGNIAHPGLFGAGLSMNVNAMTF